MPATPAWPFWAATSDERIDTAFDLAALQPGELLVDLGCGDGRVLLRAAVLRGARVRGVEIDPGLAHDARSLLAANGVDGEVIEADFTSAPLDGDVVFAYLSPATLQRLRARLTALADGARVVTTGYAVPGWEPDEVAGRCYLYRLPPAVTAPTGPLGWEHQGLLVAARPGAPSLVAARVRHPGGPVRLATTGDLDVASVRAGADDAQPGDEVVVDIRTDAMAAGATLTGTVHVDGAGALVVAVVAAEGEPQVWGLGGAGVAEIERAVATGTVAALVDRARAPLRSRP